MREWLTLKLSSGGAPASYESQKTIMPRRLLVCSLSHRRRSCENPFGEPRGRSFGLVRFDLWLQIDPSALDSSAGYISRRA